MCVASYPIDERAPLLAPVSDPTLTGGLSRDYVGYLRYVDDCGDIGIVGNVNTFVVSIRPSYIQSIRHTLDNHRHDPSLCDDGHAIVSFGQANPISARGYVRIRAWCMLTADYPTLSYLVPGPRLGCAQPRWVCLQPSICIATGPRVRSRTEQCLSDWLHSRSKGEGGVIPPDSILSALPLARRFHEKHQV